MDVSTALFITLVAAVFAFSITFFGTMLSGDGSVRFALLGSFAMSVAGISLLMRKQLVGGAAIHAIPVVSIGLLVICCAVGTLVGGAASALLMKAWRTWMTLVSPKS